VGFWNENGLILCFGVEWTKSTYRTYHLKESEFNEKKQLDLIWHSSRDCNIMGINLLDIHCPQVRP
jgi:uncharacterized membrane protein